MSAVATPLLICGGNPVVNTVAELYFRAHPDCFNGDSVDDDMGLEMVFACRVAPTGVLNPADTPTPCGGSGAGPANIEITFSQVDTKIYVWEDGKRGDLQQEMTVTVQAWGVLGLDAQGKLDLNVHCTAVHPDLAGLIKQMVDKHLVPALVSAVEGATLPNLGGLFGSKLQGTASALSIEGGRFVIGYTLSGASDIAVPPPVEPGGSTLLMVVSRGAAASVAHALVSGLSYPFEKSKELKIGILDVGNVGVSGKLSFSSPDLDVKNSQVTATTVVSTTLKAWYKPITNGVSIPVPDVSAKIALAVGLGPDARTAAVTLQGVESVDLKLGWPSVLDPVAKVLNELFHAVTDPIWKEVSADIAGKSFDLATLGTTLPGTDVPATLTFAPGYPHAEGVQIETLVEVAS